MTQKDLLVDKGPLNKEKGKNKQSETHTGWRALGIHGCIKILIITALFYYLFQDEIDRIVYRWRDPNWSHGFLIPLFSLYLINQRRKEILNLQAKPSYLGLLFLILAVLIYVFNHRIVNPSGYAYFRRLSMIATLGAVVLFLGGWRLVKHAWLPIIFLLFAIPLPDRLYVSLTMPMRHLAASVATVLLNLIPKMEATATGVIIDVFYKGQKLERALNVADACSGMRLLMAFLALGVAMAYLHYRPIWQRLILLASTIPIAIFCNIVRVTATGFIYVLIDPKYTEGIYHSLLGIVMLPLAFGLYGFLTWFMSSLFVDESTIAKDIVVRGKK